jgi:hypothetical protein
MVMAPVAAGRGAALRALLDTMNSEPGIADPRNALVPFGEFGGLHFARLVVLDDPTLVDVEAIGLPRPDLPTWFAFMGDCDGDAHEMLAAIARGAERGLRTILAHCEGFDAPADLLAWMVARDAPIAARYVNSVGRTVRQVKEESALQHALSARVPRGAAAAGRAAQQIRAELKAYVNGEIDAGRLALTPPAATPFGWWLANLLHLVAVPIAGLVLLPFLLVLSPVIIVMLREREKSDPEIYPPPDPAALAAMQALEDRDITNQYTALGSVKPGLFRRLLVSGLLVLVDYAARHVFTRGFLARVQTIHFARWVFVDDRRRVFFASNYDGGHQAYMDDFINKVAWGLNLVFSNGSGWPRTDWLILRGARIEQKFKPYQRRHQLPTQVWYKAYPGLGLVDLARNQRIREGLQAGAMSEAQALQWLRLL